MKITYYKFKRGEQELYVAEINGVYWFRLIDLGTMAEKYDKKMCTSDCLMTGMERKLFSIGGRNKMQWYQTLRTPGLHAGSQSYVAEPLAYMSLGRWISESGGEKNNADLILDWLRQEVIDVLRYKPETIKPIAQVQKKDKKLVGSNKKLPVGTRPTVIRSTVKIETSDNAKAEANDNKAEANDDVPVESNGHKDKSELKNAFMEFGKALGVI